MIASGGVSRRSTLALRRVEALDVDSMVDADVAHHGKDCKCVYEKQAVSCGGVINETATIVNLEQMPTGFIDALPTLGTRKARLSQKGQRTLWERARSAIAQQKKLSRRKLLAIGILAHNYRRFGTASRQTGLSRQLLRRCVVARPVRALRRTLSTGQIQAARRREGLTLLSRNGA